MLRTLLSLFALFVTLPASAQGFTAGALAGMCSSQAQAAACAFYIQGYAEGRNQALARPTVCIPPTAPLPTVVAGFATHIANNRLEANIAAGLVVGNYLLATYPCR
jgi:Rap1a immunity proteins